MIRRRCCGIIVAGMLFAVPALGQTDSTTSHTPHASVQAIRVNRAPTIDGHLTDEGWTLAPPATEFIQRDPDEGQPATERTDVRVLYDDQAIFIGIRMFDSQASLISMRLASRDQDPDADWVTVFLDPMHDTRPACSFV